MLKHVQTSPHRNISSTSLKRTHPGVGSPKHIRQSSTPVSLSVPRQSDSPSGSESSWLENTSCCTSHSSSSVSSSAVPRQEDPVDERKKRLGLSEIPSSKSPEPDLNLATYDSEPTAPVIICPNCHKKKKSAIPSATFNLCNKPVTKELPQPLTCSDKLSCGSLEYSMKCLSSRNGGECDCSKVYLQSLLHNPPATNLSKDATGVRSLSSTPSSGLSSFSSSSSSLSSSTKSPQSFLRNKCHRIILEETTAGLGRSDDVSLNSSISCSTSSQEERLYSFASSGVSLQDNIKHTTVRVWVRCLLQEMEYKTLCVTYTTTCRQVVSQLLSKFKMKHRDPNLFYLAMEVTIRKAGAEVRTCLQLDDSAFPAQLVECHPKEDSRLALRMRRGGLLRIYDEALSQGSHYKSLLVGEKISCAEVVSLVLACNKVSENSHNFSLFEVWPEERRERVLYLDEEPMLIASQWPENELVRFEIRRYPKLSNHDRTAKADAIIQTTPATIGESSSLELATGILVAAETAGTDDEPKKEVAILHEEKSKTSSTTTKENHVINISSCNKALNRSLKSLILYNSVKLKAKRKERSKSSCFDNFYFITKDKRFDSNPEISDDSSSGFNSVCSVSPSPEEWKPNPASFKRLNSSSLTRQRRKLPQPPPPLSNYIGTETSVDEGCPPERPSSAVTSASSQPEFKTYNDYENYFYI